MSWSDDDEIVALPEPKRIPLRRPQAEASDAQMNDTDSDTTEETLSDSSDDSNEALLPQLPRQGKAGLDGADGAKEPGALSAPVVKFIDYDSMTPTEFTQLLMSKTKKRVREERVVTTEDSPAAEPPEKFIDIVGGYTYSFMLSRVLAELREHNPELGVGRVVKVKLPVPTYEKSGTKKTAITNFKAMCKAVGRSTEDVKDFIEKHLTTQASIDMNDCLILRIQNVKQQQIEGWFHKYIDEYCLCLMCGKIDTELDKDTSSRLITLKCRSCKASRTVQAAVSATYQATTTKRSRLRNRL